MPDLNERQGWDQENNQPETETIKSDDIGYVPFATQDDIGYVRCETQRQHIIGFSPREYFRCPNLDLYVEKIDILLKWNDQVPLYLVIILAQGSTGVQSPV